MRNDEARGVLAAELAKLRGLSYSELVARLLDRKETVQVVAASGTTYQVEVQGLWDDRPGDDLRVLGAIDDGGLRAFVPLTDGFLVPSPGPPADDRLSGRR
ncbi:MAG TPA: hypothetical protein VNO56_03205 [Gaiellaceae bacterium]|nr:hypothetical protein [Gaiellaceae bacterium]